METEARLRRWRLILGEEAGDRLSGMGGCGLSEEDAMMDQARAAI